MCDYEKLIENALFDFLPSKDCHEKKLIDSMEYSLKAGGKRVRPRLVFEFNLLCSGNPESAVPFACAVEMIHTYSLIHDDLPCMDDDDLRRGKPSNHKVFGEDIALLAGDALLTLAFETITSDKAVKLSGESASRKAANILAKYSGASGMVGGQVIDLISENANAPIEVLKEMDYKKTACLIKAACELGAVSAKASDEQIKAASLYGECIGLAFQIKDDILDVVSTDDELGKPVGSDKENSKSTYVSLLGLEECGRLVNSLTEKAVKALEFFDGDTSSLASFAYKLAQRTK
jgi:geranylgeranyl diphosphate synthase type II